MGNIFRWDSPFMQKVSKAGNLILLNILWILCSIPVLTMGAATAALYHVIFQYQTAGGGPGFENRSAASV